MRAERTSGAGRGASPGTSSNARRQALTREAVERELEYALGARNRVAAELRRHDADGYEAHRRRVFMSEALRPEPRQRGFLHQRVATERALGLARGRQIGRRTREKLRDLVPEEIHQMICKPTRKRRQVMFATKHAGKGIRVAARKPREKRDRRC